jgi:hypothetical protein
MPHMLPSLRRVREVREKAEKKRNERIMLMTTIAGVAISIAAAGAALWTGYEAHETRRNDERPFVAVDASTEIPQAMQFASNQQFSPGELLPLQTVVTAFGKSPSERIHITCAIVADNPGVEWKQTKTFAKWDFAFLLPSPQRNRKMLTSPTSNLVSRTIRMVRAPISERLSVSGLFRELRHFMLGHVPNPMAFQNCSSDGLNRLIR